MDITPNVPSNRILVDSYGPGRFQVARQEYNQSLLLLPESVTPWGLTDISELTIESLEHFVGLDDPIEVLIIGCGDRMAMISSSIKNAMREKGISLDQMSTGAACRTFNILMSEGRRAGAALIRLPDSNV